MRKRPEPKFRKELSQNIVTRKYFSNQTKKMKAIKTQYPTSGGVLTRRKFLAASATVGSAILLPGSIFAATDGKKTFTILHTNDLHSNFMGMSPESDYTPFNKATFSEQRNTFYVFYSDIAEFVGIASNILSDKLPGSSQAGIKNKYAGYCLKSG